MSLLYFFPILLFPLIFLIGCSKKAEEQNKIDTDTVAIVGDASISLQQLEDAVRQARPGLQPDEVLDRLILREAMVQRALNEGLDKDPAVRERIRSTLVQALKQKHIQPSPEKSDYSDKSLRIIYEQNLENFTQPERINIAILVTPDKSPASLKRLQDALDEMTELPAEKGFGQLARNLSGEKVTRYRGGVVGTFEAERPPGFVETPLLEAASGLKEVGSISTILPTESGYGVVRLIAREPSEVSSFESVLPALKQMHRQESALQQRDQFEHETLSAMTIQKASQHILDSLNKQSLQKTPSVAGQ